MSSNEPDGGRRKVDCRQKVSCGFVIACGNGSELLKLTEKVLDKMSRLVEFLVVDARLLPTTLGRNDRFFPGSQQRLDDALIRIVPFVSYQRIRLNERQQCVRPIQVAGLSGRQHKASRIAQGIGRGIDLCAQAPSTASDGLALTFFLAPALC